MQRSVLIEIRSVDSKIGKRKLLASSFSQWFLIKNDYFAPCSINVLAIEVNWQPCVIISWRHVQPSEDT